MQTARKHFMATSDLQSNSKQLRSSTYLQHSNFSQRNLPYQWIIFRLHKLFDGYNLPCIPVSALEYDAIRSFANFTQFLVFLHVDSLLAALTTFSEMDTEGLAS